MLEDPSECDHGLNYAGEGGRQAVVYNNAIYIVCLRCGYKVIVL